MCRTFVSAIIQRQWVCCVCDREYVVSLRVCVLWTSVTAGVAARQRLIFREIVLGRHKIPCELHNQRQKCDTKILKLLI